MPTQLATSACVGPRIALSAGPRGAAPGVALAKRPRLVAPRAARFSVACQAGRNEDVRTRVAAPLAPEAETENQPRWGAAEDNILPPSFSDLSYNQQYDQLFAKELNLKRMVAKPNKDAQAKEPGAKPVPFSDVMGLPRRRLFFGREWSSKDIAYATFMVFVHGLALLAPLTFSWPMVGLFVGSYLVTGCLGITLSYHRQLSHRSFTTPKWLEYVFAYCGVLAIQGDPIEWVSCHRYHHLHCDTPLDPHSPYEGFWWSHMGWLLDHGATVERIHDTSNAADMNKDPFYQHLAKHYAWHVVAQFALLYALGGLPAMVWGGALRAVWVYHITWFVNSASHVWGYQTYNTGDLSRNNWWVGVLAFGEGWHNNHHAFEFSARHGLEWWQMDMTYMVIQALQAVGLATNVKLPTEKQKARLAFPAPQ